MHGRKADVDSGAAGGQQHARSGSVLASGSQSARSGLVAGGVIFVEAVDEDNQPAATLVAGAGRVVQQVAEVAGPVGHGRGWQVAGPAGQPASWRVRTSRA